VDERRSFKAIQRNPNDYVFVKQKVKDDVWLI